MWNAGTRARGGIESRIKEERQKDNNPNESKTAIHQSAIERNERNEIKDSNPQKKENERKRNTTGHTTRRAEYSSVKRRDYQAVPNIRR